MKRRIAVILMILVCFVFDVAPAYAITLNCWYSDKDNGCFFPNSMTAYVSHVESGCVPAETLATYVNYAVTQWSNAGRSISRVTSGGTTPVNHGTVSYLHNLYDMFESSYAGLTKLGGVAWSTVTYNGTNHIIYKVTISDTFIKYSSSYTANAYKSTITHEFGHSFGWWDGHSKLSTDCMYPTGIVTTLSANDTAQVNQMYT
ncbi:MAG TPA: hypothetical protein VM577_16380 [Anaerovoracaceae bacterium]|nr:hypothetical protein [Anaerovoracaceae bacterium]